MVRGPRRGVAGLTPPARRLPSALVAAVLLCAVGLRPVAAQATDGADGTSAEETRSPAAASAVPDSLSSVPDPLTADTARGDSAGGIAGFFGVPWHADSASVVESMGPPISVARLGDGLRIFNYTPWFLDRDGFLALWLQEGEGMVHGNYEPVVGDCTRMLREMVRELNRRHRSLAPSTRGDVGSGVLEKDLCLAAMEDGARLTVTWEDAQGNRIRVGSRPEAPALLMEATAAGWERP